ncbi:Nudix family hydrolase [Dokdonella fugitiva]|uniref:8-oxo-dGTP diphosphatase n=1 Tax=Dokdonella fugitiva TaxID=328517 RepID=A0A4R2IFQ9_9GAMM|nr:Nudix family hydrolase [Dokdonella fugitiva]TCO42659.1 8-oxo-dGTP diphosphatase [Dokdonella fugitiva]
MPASVHVVAGVLRDAGGRVLLARRPVGKHLAGLWEFPGGKCDAGEAPVDALARELREELGIVVESARPLIAVPHRYPEQDILLDVWQVSAWTGTPHPHEGQALAWVEQGALAQVEMPPADRPVIAALALPDRYLITPAFEPDALDELLAGIERACRRGLRLVQLRQPHWPRARLADAARRARDACREHGARLLLNGDVQLAMVLGLDGVHLPARIAAGLAERPLPADRWLGVSCHDAAELLHAVRIGADFATLSPVFPTPGHEHAQALGWERFAELVVHAPMPVYALGGMEGEDVDAAWMAGAQGIAAIRALWS